MEKNELKKPEDRKMKVIEIKEKITSFLQNKALLWGMLCGKRQRGADGQLNPYFGHNFVVACDDKVVIIRIGEEGERVIDSFKRVKSSDLAGRIESLLFAVRAGV